jgi:hypothetical protein
VFIFIIPALFIFAGYLILLSEVSLDWLGFVEGPFRELFTPAIAFPYMLLAAEINREN